MKIDSDQSTYMIFQMAEQIYSRTMQKDIAVDFDDEGSVKTGRKIVRKLLKLESSTDLVGFSKVMFGEPNINNLEIDDQIRVSSYMLVVSFMRQTENLIKSMTPTSFLTLCNSFTRQTIKKIEEAYEQPSH